MTAQNPDSDTASPDGPEDREIDFPEMRHALMEPEALERYFGDIRACTDLQEITVKGGRREHADATDCSLKQARALLEAGRIVGLQLRYIWRQEAWWDTLVRTEGGIRLTRIQPPEGI